MKNSCLLGLMMSAALVLSGCEGPEGPRGSAGPEGSANVIYSDWYSPETWVAGVTFGTAERSFTMETTALTQEIVDYGVIMVYIRVVGLDPAISPLPVTFESENLNFLFRPQAGSIKVVYYSTVSPDVTPEVIPSNNQIRYVLIPGGVLDEAALSEGITSAKLIGSLDSRPYGEVCGLFDIPE